MPTPPPSPDLSSSPPPDTLASALEYIPATSPPPNLPISESMRRLRDLIQAKKLSPNSLLHFSYNGRAYSATLLPDGTLSSPAPRPQDARLHPVFHKVYSSPSEFASEMAHLALSQDPKMPRPRGRVGVNGWDECLVDGRSLASLRSEMLRERKPTPSSPPLPADAKDKPETVSKEEGLDVQPVSENAADDVNKNCADKGKEKETSKVSLGKGVKEKHDDATGAEKEDREDTVDVSHTEDGMPKRTDARTDDVPVDEGGVKEDKPKLEPPLPRSPSLGTIDDKGDEEGRDAEGVNPDIRKVTSNDDGGVNMIEAGEKPNGLDVSEATRNVIQREEDVQEEGADKVKESGDSESARGEMFSDKNQDHVISAKSNEETDDKGNPAVVKAGEQGLATEPAPEAKGTSEIVGEQSRESIEKPEEEESNTPINSQVPEKVPKEVGDTPVQRKRKSLSPSKQENKKRKRTDGMESVPSEANTPTRQGQERSTRRRAEWNRHGRKIEIPTATELDTEGLDPEAMEAVAIAAQAEKDEANSRGRRTTRLASGTIKQVDYKAAGNAHGLRAFSPSNEDEVENNHSGDSYGEGGRAARRRAVQNQTVAPQRKSNRVARMRNSQEKDQTLNEEHDHFSPGAGSDGRGDGSAGGSQNDFDAGSASGSRMNGTKLDGRDRKRARADARKYRHISSEAVEFEGYDRSYYGTRSSTREDAGAHAEGTVDTDEHLDDMDIEHTDYMEDDPEQRIDAHGWTGSDLTSIGEAIGRAKSTNDDDILKELKADNKWKSEESTNQRVRRYIRKAVGHIRENKVEHYDVAEDEDVTESELLAYVAMDTWRIQSGGPTPPYPRSQARILESAEKVEKVKAGFEKTRRKAQREVDDLRHKMDCELEVRRKVAMDAAYVEVLLIEASKRLPAEESRRKWLEKVIERYRTWDLRTRNELDKTKILVSHLRGERESPDILPSAQKNSAAAHSPERKRNENENGDIEKEARRPGESVVSDENMDVTHKEEASPSQRQLEMERLRVLIETKEAEAEGYQRACEKERIRFNTLMEAKTRLEGDLYLSKSSAVHAQGGPSAIAGPSHHKSTKDVSRKGDNKNGTTGVNRHSGHAKSKSNNGKQSLGVNPTIAKTKPSNSNNPRALHGKNGETAKSSKKKSSGKVSGGQGEKH